MDLMQAQAIFGSGELTEVVIEPADEGNGWMILLNDSDGGSQKLTDHGGHEKVYHDLDHATEAARAIGDVTLRIEEPF